MEYSIFEKIGNLLDNFNSIDKFCFVSTREKNLLILYCNIDFFSKEELKQEITNYINYPDIELIFCVKE